MSIKDSNYYNVQGFMRTKMNLKGLELNLYAIIYGFSQTGNQYFTGNLSYLQEWTGCTKQGLIKALKSLEYKEYISKSESVIDGAKVIRYKALITAESVKLSLTEPLNSVEQPLNSVEQGVKLSLTDELNPVEQESKQSLTTHYNNKNNIFHNNSENNNNNILADKSADASVKRSKSSDFVKPSMKEVYLHIVKNKLNVKVLEFYNYYESNGWRVGKNPMKDWQAALMTWHLKSKDQVMYYD